MRMPPAALLAGLAALLSTPLGVTACTTAVAGRPVADPNAGAIHSSATRHTTNLPPPGATVGPDEDPRVDDVVDDECLLSATEFSALAGQAVTDRRQQAVNFGSHKQNSCFYFAEGTAGPIGRIDVFGVKGAGPAETVKRNIARFNGHPIDAVNGGFTAPTQQGGGELFVAGRIFLVDIEINHPPAISDAQWKTAATTAVHALEG